MKKRSVLLVMLLAFTLSPLCLASDRPAGFPQKIKSGFYKVSGGKIQILNGSWRIFDKDDGSYLCLCKFTLINMNNRSYTVTPYVNLFDKNGTKIFEIRKDNITADKSLFKETTLLAERAYGFTGKFSVPKEIALQTQELRIKLSVENN